MRYEKRKELEELRDRLDGPWLDKLWPLHVKEAPLIMNMDWSMYASRDSQGIKERARRLNQMSRRASKKTAKPINVIKSNAPFKLVMENE